MLQKRSCKGDIKTKQNKTINKFQGPHLEARRVVQRLAGCRRFPMIHLLTKLCHPKPLVIGLFTFIPNLWEGLFWLRIPGVLVHHLEAALGLWQGLHTLPRAWERENVPQSQAVEMGLHSSLQGHPSHISISARSQPYPKASPWGPAFIPCLWRILIQIIGPEHEIFNCSEK